MKVNLLAFLQFPLLFSSTAGQTTELSVSEPVCTSTGKYPAPSCYQYYDCIYVMWWYDAQLTSCPDGQAFDISLKECASVALVNCQTRTTTPSSGSTSTTTTTIAPIASADPSVPLPACIGPGRFASSICYQYYECTQVQLWWSPVLTSCADGYAFDSPSSECKLIALVDCSSRSTTTALTTKTTTTTTASVTVPTCTGAGRLPAESCYQYYDCTYVLWWWEPVLKTCEVGYAFDTLVIECRLIAVVDCQQRLTTTVSTPTTTTLAPITVPSCSGPGKYPAESCYQFYECISVWWWYEPRLQSCEIGYAFDTLVIECRLVAVVDCQQRLTTTVSTPTTTTLAPITVPSCSGPGKHPAESCYQYYECVSVWWWYEPKLLSCEVGYAFDTVVIDCRLIAVVDCQQRLTTTVSTPTTTTLAPITVPSCSGPGKYPAESCYQFYECISVWWWYEPRLQSCEIGYAFDTLVIECRLIAVVDCQQRLTTTVSTPTTTTLAPITVPSCSGPGKHPAESCYQYYECVSVWWWYEPKLLSCEVGYAFDTVVIDCRLIAVVDCQQRLTTTVSPPTTTTLAPITVSSCSGPGKYPAESCYQFYECISVWWWYEPRLQSCEIGYAFDTLVIECRLIAVVDCQQRLTTTVSTPTTTTLAPITVPSCSGPGKHPAESCYQYYECVSVWWWYEPKLLSCEVGYAFDTVVIDCRLIAVVDCQQRLTTTVSPPTTTTLAPITVSSCSGPGKYPAESCYQFYECVSVWWWYEPRLQSCEVGYAFDTLVIECRLIAVVDCQQRLTTTVSTPTTTIAPITVPSCSGPGKHPAESCYQYYECVSVWWWYEPKLLSCEVGYAFDTVVIDCRLIAVVDCQQRLTTTVSPTKPTTVAPVPPVIIVPEPACYGPDKYPAGSCYEYYECVAVWWWWEPRLKTCNTGLAFDILVRNCRQEFLVDCQHRLTTTVSTPETTTTSLAPLPPVTVPACSGVAKYPADSCYQYYECVPVLWWFEPRLQTCEVGYAFDTIVVDCRLIAVVDCQQRLTTTISTPKTTTTTTLAPLPPIPVPACYGPNKYAAESCYQYYECVSVWWWWEPRLLTCDIGYAFDVLRVECRLIEVVDCQQRIHNTRPPPKPTHAPAPPVIVVPEPACYGPDKYPAGSCYEYYECVSVWWWFEPRLKTCTTGFAFDILVRDCRREFLVDCQHRLTTTVSTPETTTTSLSPLPPVTVPACSGVAKYPADSCYQYYECVPALWWFEPRLQTCEVGYAFDTIVVDCRLIAVVDCQQRLTTTISTPKTTTTTTLAPLPPIPVPACYGPNKYAAESCYQYYECVSVWWWWEPRLLTCDVGYAFDVLRVECRLIEVVDCQQRIHNTRPPPKPTHAPAPPAIVVPEPACHGPEKYPAGSCYEYYECESVWWWWEPRLKVCKIGFAFDILVGDCRREKHVNCHHRLTTTVTPKTTTTSIVPLPPVTVPSCSAAAKYPAESCYQYYECVPVLWWFEPRLQTCEIGYAFDTVVVECRLIAFVDCRQRLTTTISTPKTTTTTILPPPIPIPLPSCYGPNKYPTESCHQYYECVSVWWWWEPRLRSCEKGHAFDTLLSKCRPKSLVDCRQRLTTVKPPPLITIPTCHDSSRYPAPLCYQYYQCVQDGWGWEPQLKTCPPGQSFDVWSKVCYPNRHVHCEYRQTTPLLPPPTTPTAPLPPVVIPTCKTSGKYRADLCYQYYECVSVWWWWEPELKTCPDGQGFDHRKKQCLCAELIGCKLPIKEPECYGSGKYPAKDCNQYYECVSVWWWWQPELKNCPHGHGFDVLEERCVKGWKCHPPK